MNFRYSKSTNPYNVVKLDDDKYVISVLMPGYSKEEVKVRMRNGTLYVEAAAKDETEGVSAIRLGYVLSGVNLSLYVGDDHEVETAKLTDGVLYVTLVDKNETFDAIVVS